jgi:hypothetical protein
VKTAPTTETPTPGTEACEPGTRPLPPIEKETEPPGTIRMGAAVTRFVSAGPPAGAATTAPAGVVEPFATAKTIGSGPDDATFAPKPRSRAGEPPRSPPVIGPSTGTISRR